jgi:hypothetical protein
MLFHCILKPAPSVANIVAPASPGKALAEVWLRAIPELHTVLSFATLPTPPGGVVNAYYTRGYMQYRVDDVIHECDARWNPDDAHSDYAPHEIVLIVSPIGT